MGSLMFVVILLIFAICVFLIGSYGYFLYIKYQQRKLWDDLYALLKIKFALFIDLIIFVKDTCAEEPEILTTMMGCVKSFIMAKTPSETAAAHLKAQTAIKGLERLLDKRPLILDSNGYVKIKDEMVKIDEKIGFACQFYNDSAEEYNSKISNLPLGIVAGIFNFRVKGYIDIKLQ